MENEDSLIFFHSLIEWVPMSQPSIEVLEMQVGIRGVRSPASIKLIGYQGRQTVHMEKGTNSHYCN